MTDTALAKLLAEKYGPPIQARAPNAQRPQPVAPLGSSVPQVIKTAMTRPEPLPQGRVSRTNADSGFGWYWSAENLGRRSRIETIELCRAAVVEDGDAAGALRDLVALANPGYSLVFTGSDRVQNRAKKELDALEKRLGDFRTWDELINHQIREAYVAGASSLEAYPTPKRSGVAGVEVVPAEEVTILRDGNARVFRQMQFGVNLDPRTYYYSGYGVRGRDPYGTPAMVAALVELQRKAKLIDGADKIMKLLADGAFLQLGVPKPTPQELNMESDNTPEYWAALEAWYTSYVTIAIQAREYGIMVTENGVDAKTIPVTSTVTGVSDLADIANLRLWSGLITLPFMRGKNEHTTQALAEIVYPILLSHAANLQIVVRPAIQFVMNLHLQLAGIASQVSVNFKTAPNAFLESHAMAAYTQAQADAIYIAQLGDPYIKVVAARLDL